MLKTRVITATVLLAILIPVLFSNSFIAVGIVSIVFFSAAAWESFRLFGVKQPEISAVIWASAFAAIVFFGDPRNFPILFGLCAAIWSVRLAPSLTIGLPPLIGVGNRLLNGMYIIAILGCFLAIVTLFKHSAAFLLSVMAIVWCADIGAYFTGKAFGKRKLAASISPGKTWEGAIGGWMATLLLAAASTKLGLMIDTFPTRLLAAWGWLGFAGVISLIVALSVVGDLFESQLKRRASMKDSSNLLPGHGGVLDRIDALIPTLPLAALFSAWF